jgi:predicted ATPase
MFSFKVIKNCWNNIYYDKNDVDFLLEEKKWNDYGYYTLYILHATRKLIPSTNKSILLGFIHIMKLGQEVIEQNLLSENGNIIFSVLPKDFYSISFDINIYRWISKNLNKYDRSDFISSLRLILSEEDEYYPIVKHDYCFLTSMLRDGYMRSPVLLKGRSLLLQNGMGYELRNQRIIVDYANSTNKVSLDFSEVIAAFVGKNGCGKSTALYKLAFLLNFNIDERKQYISDIGEILPANIEVSNTMLISFSPFDNFLLPIKSSDFEDEHHYGFAFYGLRDIKKELEISAKSKKSKGKVVFSKRKFRTKDVLFKSQNTMGNEMNKAYWVIKNSYNKNQDYNLFVSYIKKTHSGLCAIINKIEKYQKQSKSISDVYNKLSASYKVFLYSIMHILAYCEEDTFIIFDTPESNVQEPLLLLMISEIKKILIKRDSVLLVATNSPDILQEIPDRCVYTIQKKGNKVTFH